MYPYNSSNKAYSFKILNSATEDQIKEAYKIAGFVYLNDKDLNLTTTDPIKAYKLKALHYVVEIGQSSIIY